MTTSVMIHHVTSVKAGPVFHSNANSVSLYVSTSDAGDFSFTFFDLPLRKAEHIARVLGDDEFYTEEEIRADERRKIASKLGL